jgi:hypothetical protein
MNGLFKTELYRNPAVLERNGGPWKGLTHLEVAICAWVEWFNERRFHSELGDCTLRSGDRLLRFSSLRRGGVSSKRESLHQTQAGPDCELRGEQVELVQAIAQLGAPRD